MFTDIPAHILGFSPFIANEFFGGKEGASLNWGKGVLQIGR